MTRTSGRIVISSNLKHQLELAKAIFSKHIMEGPNSPLLSLQGVDIGASAAKIDTAMEQHEIAENYKRQMEMAYRQRDILHEEVIDLTRKSIKLLKAVYADNPKKLGEWGINVDDSSKKKDSSTEV